MAHDEGITWLTDVSAADWIAPRLHPFNVDTGSVIPEGFEAYCRIFHPVEPDWPETRTRRWADIAAENGRVVHSEMQFHMINAPWTLLLHYSGMTGGVDLDGGMLPLSERRELVECAPV